MPFYLKEIDVAPEVTPFRSALIVVCRFCPAASMALREQKPYLEPFTRFANTGVFEQHLDAMQVRLEAAGIATSVYRGNLLNFIICMWTSQERKKFLECAQKFESVVVMGCEAAVEGVRDMLRSTGCRVLRGMECEGVFDVKPRMHGPGKISLEMVQVTPVSPCANPSG